MKRRALFIGVNRYEDDQIRDLDYSLSDAHALKTMFELLGYQSDILEDPTKSDVFSAVRKMTADLSAGDLFFFYFAGHGWTTSGGKHLLFCADDQYEDLRYDYNVGIPFDILKMRTEAGGYNRAFVLDACRSDFITGTRGNDTTTRDLRPIGELVKDASSKSSIAVLRSCSQYEHALEIKARKHGLFTLAMMEVLRTSRENGSELLFGESLCDAVTDKMHHIAEEVGITAGQTPEFAKSGAAQVLIEGRKIPSYVKEPSSQSIGTESPSLVKCPVCGRWRTKTDTFDCRECGRKNICIDHQDHKTFLCTECSTMIAQANTLYAKGADYYQGRNGCLQDYAEAAKWFRMAAEQGDADSQFALAIMYAEGNGVPQDDTEAAKWYRKAAEQGDAEAQYNLALIYATGKVGKQDYAEAAKWFHMAAEQGNANAQRDLGFIYENGYGVPKDHNEAVKWYHKAAEQGDAVAQKALDSRFTGAHESEADIEKAGLDSQMRFFCPKCQSKLSADKDMVGVEVDCPVCGGRLTVPTPETENPTLQPSTSNEVGKTLPSTAAKVKAHDEPENNGPYVLDAKVIQECLSQYKCDDLFTRDVQKYYAKRNNMMEVIRRKFNREVVLEDAVALLDCTVFGSAKNGVLFCCSGFYALNDWKSDEHTGFVSWVDFSQHGNVKVARSYELHLCDSPNVGIELSGCSMNPPQAAQMFEALLKLVKGR